MVHCGMSRMNGGLGRLVVGGCFDGEAVLGPTAIIHRDGSILAIEPARPGEAACHAFVLPTLVDAHVHVFLDGAVSEPEARRRHHRRSPAELAATADSNAAAAIGRGIGLVRDGGDPHGVNDGLRARLRAGSGRLTVRSPGPALHRPGRYGGFLGLAVPDDRDLAALVGQLAERADDIKVLLTGPIDVAQAAVHGQPQFDLAAARTIVATARAHGRPAFAHANGAAGIAVAIAAGFDSLEHGYLIDDESLRRMAGQGMAWTPTLAPLAASRGLAGALDRILADHAEAVARAARLGVTVLCGSDAGGAGVPHGDGLIDEMLRLAAAGLPMAALLRAATTVPRARWGETAAGIRPGGVLDLVALAASPFERPEALRSARRA